MLMLGNLFKESGVVERLSKAASNELMNIVTIFLGLSVGATMTAGTFLSPKVLFIFFLGLFAFIVSTAAGLIMAKIMNLFLKDKINPLIGAAGVSAVPMAARCVHKVGSEANRRNYLLMHAMGPNVAGVIGTVVAAAILLKNLGIRQRPHNRPTNNKRQRRESMPELIAPIAGNVWKILVAVGEKVELDDEVIILRP